MIQSIEIAYNDWKEPGYQWSVKIVEDCMHSLISFETEEQAKEYALMSSLYDEAL